MKTLSAILAHVGVGLIQVIVPAAPQIFSTAPIPSEVQAPIQVGLLALQAYLASRNSKTDPKGNPLVELSPNKFVSAPNSPPTSMDKPKDF